MEVDKGVNMGGFEVNEEINEGNDYEWVGYEGDREDGGGGGCGGGW